MGWPVAFVVTEIRPIKQTNSCEVVTAFFRYQSMDFMTLVPSDRCCYFIVITITLVFELDFIGSI